MRGILESIISVVLAFAAGSAIGMIGNDSKQEGSFIFRHSLHKLGFSSSISEDLLHSYNTLDDEILAFNKDPINSSLSPEEAQNKKVHLLKRVDARYHTNALSELKGYTYLGYESSRLRLLLDNWEYYEKGGQVPSTHASFMLEDLRSSLAYAMLPKKLKRRLEGFNSTSLKDINSRKELMSLLREIYVKYDLKDPNI